MSQSQILIVNTASSVMRRAITFGVGLLVTRLALGALGPVDYGLLATLGAAGLLLMLLSDAFTVSAQRHLAHALGRMDRLRLITTFDAALLAFALLALLLGAFGLALAPRVVEALSVPASRAAAARQVFELTVLVLGIQLLATPYRAVLRARQAILLLEGIQLVQSFAQLAAVAALLWLGGDALIRYAQLLVLCHALGVGLVIGSAMRRYEESRPRLPRLHRKRIRELTGFAGWTVLLQVGWRLRLQGELLLLGALFGPVTGAAYAISGQVAGYLVAMTGSVLGAVQPAMAMRHGRGDEVALRHLALLSGKYSGLLTLFLLVPLLLEAPWLLRTWLDEVPPDSATFARLSALAFFVSALSNGHNAAIQATGRLARYARVWLGLLATPILLGSALFAVGPYPAWTLPALALGVSGFATCVRASMVGAVIGLPFRAWLVATVRPVAVVAALGGACALAVHVALPEGLARLALGGLAFAATALPAIWFLALEEGERIRFSQAWTSRAAWSSAPRSGASEA